MNTVRPGPTSAAVTAAVGPNVNITQAAGAQAEGTIAINPTNTQELFFASNPGATTRRSTDGGATWVAAGAGIGATCCDNVAAWDSFGNLFLVNINGALNAIPLYLSIDGGANFTLLVTIDTGSIDQPSVKAGAGSVWVTWNDGTIKARGAAVTGLGAGNIGAFSAEQAAPDANTVVGQFGDIAIGPNGEVAVTYQSDTNIFLNVDADGLGAGGFGAQVLVTSTNVAKFDFIPAQDARSIDAEANLAWDRSGGPFNGRLYLVYTDEAPDESNDTDIFLRFSNDNGATWSAAVRVNDDVTTRSQFLSTISIDQTTGNVAVTWHDARNDAGNNNTQFFGAVSDTGGVSFGANFQISAGTSNDDTGGSGVDYGDYTWSDFHDGRLHVVWADNSNSTGDNPAGANSTFDMYTSAIVIVGGPAGTCPSNFALDFSGSEYTDCFRDLLRGSEIDDGFDVGATIHSALNFTGSTGSTASTWLTVYDRVPTTPVADSTFGAETLCADVLIERFNNGKGAGVVALLNEGAGSNGLALFIRNAGNTDQLFLSTIDGDPAKKGKLTTLTSVSLVGSISEKAWYRLIMTIDPATPMVTGKVFTHATATDPNSALGTQVGGTLTFSPGVLPLGVAAFGENGIMATATSAVVNSSVTNFTNDLTKCSP